MSPSELLTELSNQTFVIYCPGQHCVCSNKQKQSIWCSILTVFTIHTGDVALPAPETGPDLFVSPSSASL